LLKCKEEGRAGKAMEGNQPIPPSFWLSVLAWLKCLATRSPIV